MFLFGIGMMILKAVWAVIKFTGIWWLLIFMLPWMIYEEIIGAPIPRGSFLDVVSNGFFYMGWIMVALNTIQNIIRAVTKNPRFRLINLFSKNLKAKEKAIQAPKAHNELLSSQAEGFIFGRQGGYFVRKSMKMDGHALAIGGAGSGKSSCVAIPSLMSWKSRVFAIDIKGELYNHTRKKRLNIKVFNPLSAESAGYDPYYLLAKSRNPVQDAREIALAIIPTSQGKQAEAEPFWTESAQNVFTGAILHFHGEGLTFPQTIAAMQSTPIETLISTIHNSDTQDARYFVNQFVGMELKTLASIFSTLGNKIMVFATDPDIKACLAKRDCISPKDIERGKDIYLQIPEDKIEQWKGLLTLIVNQFLKHFERRPDTDATPVLFLLDEFARLGKVETVINGLATLRSKKVTICILTQSLAQLDVIYGKEQRQVIADNCQYKAVLNATDADTQDYFSRLVGTFDKSKSSTYANFEQYTGLGKGTGTSETTEDRRIIKPEEFATLSDIVLLSPFGFFRVEKAPYYKDKAFM